MKPKLWRAAPQLWRAYLFRAAFGWPLPKKPPRRPQYRSREATAQRQVGGCYINVGDATRPIAL
jgi:hypothetical protein